MGQPPLSTLLSGFVDGLPVDGGSITVISPSRLSSTVAVSDPLAARLDALQIDLGEGPRWEAYWSAAPILVPDVASDGASASWPLFGAAIEATPVRGVFAFPLRLGLLVVGVVDMYCRSVGRAWTTQEITDASRTIATVARPAVSLAARSASSAEPTSGHGSAELRREVHQATGILVVWLEVSPDEALARLQAHAFAIGRPVLEVAREVIDRRLDADAFT